MRTDLPRWPRVAIAAAAVVGLSVGVAATAVVVGLADDRDDLPTTTQRVDGPVTLISYDTCESALEELKAAALPHIGPYGLGGGQNVATDFGDSASSSEGDVAAAPGARAQEKAAEPPAAQAEDQGAAGTPAREQREHSGTNVNESGVDEPDLVKTDGRRLITIANGTLAVVDVATRQRTATVPMPGGFPSQLLLDGDRALVMTGADGVVSGTTKPVPGGDVAAVEGSRLVLVDLSGPGKVIGSLDVEGAYLDARQVGSVARVVVRSMPRLKFSYPMNEANLDSVTESNRGVVENSTIADWLPRYSLDNGGIVSEGQLVECDAVSHPRRYTGSSLLTVLTIDLREELTTGDPMSIAADGDTVYGTGTNLYVADDHVAGIDRIVEGGIAPGDQVPQGAQQTEVYQFDISRPGRPVHVASGGVDGTLLNQYSLSEHEGNLRIATTVVDFAASNSSRSMVTVLTRRGNELALTGRVDGLGKGEQIYSVRYMGDVAYVVTFRQTDPLYTVDLSNPAAPRVTGELKITGYSSYMHPIGENRLLGIGQEATTDGVTAGLQLSLFDISGSQANRVGQFHLPNGYSEVENDPHAFLYWPDKNLVVLPVIGMKANTSGFAESGMLVLRISGDRLDQVGIIRHSTPQSGMQPPPPRRALVIGNSLWSVADTDIVVADLTTLTQQAHITL